MTLEEAKIEIIANCHEAQRRGKVLGQGCGAFCALVAVKYYPEVPLEGSLAKVAEDLFGWDYLESISFIYGFDGPKPPGDYYREPYYNLGREVAKELGLP